MAAPIEIQNVLKMPIKESFVVKRVRNSNMAAPIEIQNVLKMPIKESFVVKSFSNIVTL